MTYYLWRDAEGLHTEMYAPGSISLNINNPKEAKLLVDEIYANMFFIQVSKAIAFDDCTDIIIEKIVFRGKEVHYAGWQPGMMYEYKDAAGNIVWARAFPEWDH